MVTDNYLKLRLDVKRARNEWVDVRVDGEHSGRVVAELAGTTAVAGGLPLSHEASAVTPPEEPW